MILVYDEASRNRLKSTNAEDNEQKQLQERFRKDICDWTPEEFQAECTELEESVMDLLYNEAWDHWHYKMSTFFEEICWMVNFAKRVYIKGMLDYGSVN